MVDDPLRSVSWHPQPSQRREGQRSLLQEWHLFGRGCQIRQYSIPANLYLGSDNSSQTSPCNSCKKLSFSCSQHSTNRSQFPGHPTLVQVHCRLAGSQVEQHRSGVQKALQEAAVKDSATLAFFWDSVLEASDPSESEACRLSDGLSRRSAGLGRVNGALILWESCDKGL